MHWLASLARAEPFGSSKARQASRFAKCPNCRNPNGFGIDSGCEEFSSERSVPSQIYLNRANIRSDFEITISKFEPIFPSYRCAVLPVG